jgi:dephospho-CoA kinase
MMGAWPGKFIIGLTGNIATGKSVVRKMLEHLGAYGIDADALAHRAIAQGAPGYQPVLDSFGKWILQADGQIDRARLGRIVFSDPEALAQLESIVHPLVRQAVDLLVRRSRHKVLVIEAIKLLEGELRAASDSIWVSYAPEEIQLERLVRKRGLSPDVARQRIKAQPPQEEKLAAADVVILNDGAFEDTWRQVQAAWEKTFPGQAETEELAGVKVGGGLSIERSGPRQAEEIASFITRASKGRRTLDRAGVMEAFGEKAFLLLKQDQKIVGIAGWQVENLVARTGDVYLEPGLPLEDSMRTLMGQVEASSRELQCEASLLFLPPHLVRHSEVWQSLGYEARSIEDLAVRAWQEAARESLPDGMVMLFKQLRKDRVLRPV